MSASPRGRVRRLGRWFFDRPTVRVARGLLGAELTVRSPAVNRTVRIVETEAYVGHDPANHAFRGPTPRNRAMFDRPGTVYVYRIHQVVCANLVTRPGQAVLLRAGEPRTSGMPSASGPGRLCRALGITLADNGAQILDGGRFALRVARERIGPVHVGPRVGIRQAADRPLRFALMESRSVSGPRPWRRRATSASPTRSYGAGPSTRIRRRRRPLSGGGRSGGRSAGR
jgi:DNA-3-methyladenine glycosylase